MTENEYAERRKVEKDLESVLSVSVSVNHNEIMRIVARDLINKRNACRDADIVKSFDLILKSYYLDDDEFKIAISGWNKMNNKEGFDVYIKGEVFCPNTNHDESVSLCIGCNFNNDINQVHDTFVVRCSYTPEESYLSGLINK